MILLSRPFASHHGSSRLSLTVRAGLWITVGFIGIGAGCDRAPAQSLAAARVPPADEFATVAQPGSIPQPYDPTPMPGAVGVGDPSAGQDFPDDLLSPGPETTHETGLLDLIRESMFAKRGDLWRPHPLRTFFSEGWNEPWSASPRSSTGAPRQAWINAFDGVFYRLYLVSFSYYDDFEKNGSNFVGDYFLFAAINPSARFCGEFRDISQQNARSLMACHSRARPGR
jgi:hypothetical protein